MSNASATINGTVINNGDIVNSGIVNGDGEIIGNPPYNEIGSFIVTGGINGTDYEYATGVFTIKTATPVTIANKTPQTPTTDRIEVATGVSANITLSGVNIDVSTTSNAAAFKIADNSTGNVTITLADGTTNTLKSGENCAGLQKNGAYISETQGKLTITGTGSLTATGGRWAAGIGGASGGSGSNITISGGIVTAQGSDGGAGIGGGYKGNGSNITINGGTVNATGGICGAGIGGGDSDGYDDCAAGSIITINGGIVTSTGGKKAAGIGGGGNNGSGSNITISGGTVTAQGSDYGAGIGGGYRGSGSDIKISGGSVKVVVGTDANAIGGGNEQSAVTPTDGNGNNVYLLELTVDGTSAVTINGNTNYPKKHIDENKLYVYLPAKTAQSPNEVTVGNETTKYTYDTTNTKWLTVVEAPEADDYTEFTYDGTEKTYTLAESDYYTISDNTTQTNAGTYTVTVALNDKVNTVWNDGTTADKTYNFVINKATPPALTIPTATTITYGEKLSASTLSDSSWAWVNGAIVPNASADYNAYIEVDDSNYDYTDVDGYDDVNHRVVRGVDVTIRRATLTITANSYTIKVGDTLPTYAYDVTGLVNGDTLPFNVSLSCSATDSNTVGTYPITISGVASDALASLYAPIYENGTLTISEKDIQEIEADNVVLTYGETKNIGATTNGDGAITYSTTSDVISIAADGTITAHKAGTATVTVKAAETDNYAEATTTISVTVNKKKVAVPTADTTKYTYTGTAQTYGVTSTDDYTVEGGVQTNAGEYPITITLNNENYEWDGTLGTYKFVINKAAATITAKSYTIKVGDTLPTYAYDVTGLVNGETLPIDVTISCTADGKTAGTYDIVVSGAAASDNYIFSYVKGTLTVSEMEVVAAPTFTPASGTTFTSSQNVTIACATEGAKIYYTTDGTAPTTASTLYNGAITINKTTTIKAIAVKEGMTDSSVVTATYTKKSSGGGGGGYGGGTGGGGGGGSSTPTNPEINGKSASWVTIASDISKLPIGSEITIELNGNYDVPVDVIKAIADRDVKVTFVVDSTRSWYVDGAEIETPTSADLSILAIASLNTGALRGDVGTKFRVDGTNIPTELKLTVAKKNAGKFANLYKKDSDKLVFVDTAKINADGNAMLSVSEKGANTMFAQLPQEGGTDAAHQWAAGDYVVMICEFSDRKGDVSNDGVTNAFDASAILKDIVELEAGANPVMLDYNGDGKVNALDASAILIDIVNGNIA